jgi:hypothetical protein
MCQEPEFVSFIDVGLLLDFVRFLMRCFLFCRFLILKSDLLSLWTIETPSMLCHIQCVGIYVSCADPSFCSLLSLSSFSASRPFDYTVPKQLDMILYFGEIWFVAK